MRNTLNGSKHLGDRTAAEARRRNGPSVSRERGIAHRIQSAVAVQPFEEQKMVSVETSRVFRGGKRRYFNLKSACRGAAKARLSNWLREWNSATDNQPLPIEMQDRYIRALVALTDRYHRQYLRSQQGIGRAA